MGTRLTSKATVATLASVVGVDDGGSVARQTIANLSTQLAASGALANAIQDIQQATEFAIIVQATWAGLEAITGTGDGQGAEVLASDDGTHDQATATGYDGDSVANAGRYTWVEAWSRWLRIGSTGLATVEAALADKADAADAALTGDATAENLAVSGTLTAPTAAPGTDSTVVATTAFVQAAQAEAGAPLPGITGDRLARTGTRIAAADGWALDFSGATVTGGGVTDVATFARAGAAYELTDAGEFTEYASGAPAISFDRKGNARGLAIRPPAEQHAIFSTAFDNAVWVKNNVTVDVADNISGSLGDMRRIVATDTDGFHAIRQQQVMPLGDMVMTAIVMADEETAIVLALNTVAFGETKLVKFDLLTQTVTANSGTIARSGMIDLGGGEYLCWISDEVTSEATVNYQVYLRDTISWAGDNSGGLYLGHVGLYSGLQFPVPPIIATDANNVVKPADTLTQSVTVGPRFSARVRFDNTDLWAPNGATVIEMSDGTADEAITVTIESGVLTLGATAGGSDAGSQAGAAAAGDIDIALAVDLDALTIRWAINGLSQTPLTLTAAPAGIDQITYGHDHAGAGAINAILVQSDVATDAALPDATLRSITGAQASADVAATAVDRQEVVVVVGTDEINIYTAGDPAVSGDYLRHRIAYDDDPTKNREGWVRAGMWGVSRAGDYTFAPTGYQYTRDSGAPDQSAMLSVYDGAEWVPRDDFMALGGHRGQVISASALLIDGVEVPLTPGSQFKCRSAELVMKSDFEDEYTTPTNAHVAVINNSWRYTGGRETVLRYRNRITWDFDEAAYPDGLKLRTFYGAMIELYRYSGDQDAETGDMLIDYVRHEPDLTQKTLISPVASGSLVREYTDRSLWQGQNGWAGEIRTTRGHIPGTSRNFFQCVDNSNVNGKFYAATLGFTGSNDAYTLTQSEVTDFEYEFVFRRGK